MRWIAGFSYIALCTVALTACKDDESKSNGPDAVPPFSDDEYSVYMAFTYDSIPSAASKGILCSGIWTNGSSNTSASIRKLSPGRDEGVEVFDMCVTEDKVVYAAGCFGTDPLYWKDDLEVELPEGRAATGIAVDANGTVYTCGFQKEGYVETAKMWCGTKPTILKNGSRANKISLCDGKCYVAGYGNNASKWDVEEARIWIDGQSYNKLTQDNDALNDEGDYPAFANDIVSDGANWWCVGRERNSGTGYLPKVWINRSNNNLTFEGPASSLTCIKYENGVFYIGGNDGFHAKYWTATQKSNKENRINDLKECELTSSTSSQGVVEDIDVLNGIVVCCGYERAKSGSNVPKLWINGSEYSFGDTFNRYSNVKPCAVAIVRR